jgi:hypothetical protein
MANPISCFGFRFDSPRDDMPSPTTEGPPRTSVFFIWWSHVSPPLEAETRAFGNYFFVRNRPATRQDCEAKKKE